MGNQGLSPSRGHDLSADAATVSPSDAGSPAGQKIDPRTGRTLGDHGTFEDAVDWAVDEEHKSSGMPLEFLKCWREGALDEWPDFYTWLARREVSLSPAATDLLTEARELCAILDNYCADTGEGSCYDYDAIGEEVARRHDSLTAAIAKALGQSSAAQTPAKSPG